MSVIHHLVFGINSQIYFVSLAVLSRFTSSLTCQPIFVIIATLSMGSMDKLPRSAVTTELKGLTCSVVPLPSSAVIIYHYQSPFIIARLSSMVGGK